MQFTSIHPGVLLTILSACGAAAGKLTPLQKNALTCISKAAYQAVGLSVKVWELMRWRDLFMANGHDRRYLTAYTGRSDCKRVNLGDGLEQLSIVYREGRPPSLCTESSNVHYGDGHYILRDLEMDDFGKVDECNEKKAKLEEMKTLAKQSLECVRILLSASYLHNKSAAPMKNLIDAIYPTGDQTNCADATTALQ